jgi:nitric oxide reductase large subunit
MKQWVWFVLALVAVAFVTNILPGMEKFYGGPPESKMIDTSQQKRAMALEDSSYAQRTNHFKQNNDVGEALGRETPWQVNQFKSHL